MTLTQEVKDWFGGGEVDVDLMIAVRAVTEQQILELWEREHRAVEVVFDLETEAVDALRD